MMVRLIRDDLGAPFANRDDERVVIKGKRTLYWKRGAVIETDARGAELLIGNADADPADAEAESVVPHWRQNRDQILLSRAMLAAGIDPDDRDRFRRGEILGYDEDGNYIPGPNWVDPEEDDSEEEDAGPQIWQGGSVINVTTGM